MHKECQPRDTPLRAFHVRNYLVSVVQLNLLRRERVRANLSMKLLIAGYGPMSALATSIAL